MSSERAVLPRRATAGQWVQTERAAHEAWAALIAKAPKAAQLMHILTARVGEHNAVVISQKTLRSLMGCSRQQFSVLSMFLHRTNGLRFARLEKAARLTLMSLMIVLLGPETGTAFATACLVQQL